MGSVRPVIVHVSFGLGVGGLEKLLLEIGRRTNPERCSLIFVSLGSSGPVGEQLRDLGWPVVGLHRAEGLRPSLVLLLARLLRNVRADAVHTHDSRALIYGSPAAKLARIPTVIHTQHGQSLGLSDRQKWLMRIASRGLKNFVCVSRDAARIAVDSLGISTDKVKTIYNGIDIERFANKASTDGDHDVAEGPIVAVARLSPEKGVDVLLEAAAIARELAPDLKVIIAGDGPSRDSLLRRRSRLGLEACVDFLGTVDDVPGLLCQARVFVLPSRSEGISLTLLEAMSAGVAVVATHVGGTPEVVIDDETGVLTPPDDPQSLASALVRLWYDGEERNRLALAGRWRVNQYFHIDRMLDDYYRLIWGDRGLPKVNDVQSTTAEQLVDV